MQDGTAASPAQCGFFERKLPARMILVTFPLVTVPLAAALVWFTDRRFLLLYIWLFGLTHFVLTLSVYLQSENLRHFKATGKNVFLYFVVPLAILMGFYVIAILQLRDKFPIIAVALGVAVRLLDFNHLNRQSFGVYQLFKARAGLRPPPVVKRFENGYFGCLTALLLATFLAGGVFPWLQPGEWPALGTSIAKSDSALLPIGLLRIASVALGALTIVFASVSIGFLVRAWNAGGRSGGLLQTLLYMGFQTLSALMAIVSAPLYFATLAIHYVEYHVLMFPRCFHVGLDQKSSVDRWFGTLRRHRAVFYGIVLAASGLVMAISLMQANPTSALRTHPMRYLAVVSIFDGLFVFHYFVEMLIWRFSDPFFRRTLSSLYFAPRPRAA
jgi:hypothetical protein